ncbi:hypothetical protein GJ496_004600 [Pomphorhynchus laevis]|nr:hypothetical protein GJ496_004600 [Pomphorhynchus laevis]
MEDLMVVAKYDYSATEPKEMSFKKGDKFILVDDRQHWWLVQRLDGDQLGYVPSNFMRPEKKGIISRIISKKCKKFSPFLVDDMNAFSYIGAALVRHNYEAKNSDELTLSKGTKVNILQKKDDGWWFIEASMRKGWFPSNYLSETVFYEKNHILSNYNSEMLQNRRKLELFEQGKVYDSNFCYGISKERSGTLPITLSTTTQQSRSADKNLGLYKENIVFQNDCIKRCNSVQMLSSSFQTYKPSRNNIEYNTINNDRSLIQKFNRIDDSPVNPTDSLGSIVFAIASFNARNNAELNVVSGEQLKIVNGKNSENFRKLDSQHINFIKVENSFGQKGLVPNNILSYTRSNSQDTIIDINAHYILKHRTSSTDELIRRSNYSDKSLSNSESINCESNVPSKCMPIRKCRSTESLSNCNEINNDWYFGTISREQAERLLNCCGEEGSFLVRESLHSIGLAYSISVKSIDCIRHFRVEIVDGKFHIGRRKFATINELIKFYRRHAIFNGSYEDSTVNANTLKYKLYLSKPLKPDPYTLNRKEILHLHYLCKNSTRLPTAGSINSRNLLIRKRSSRSQPDCLNCCYSLVICMLVYEDLISCATIILSPSIFWCSLKGPL